MGDDLSSRWPTVRDSLVLCARPDRVASACGMSPGQLRSGLLGWAEGQLRAGRMTGTEHADVVALALEVPDA